MNNETKKSSATWICPNCETYNNGHRCTVCLSPKPTPVEIRDSNSIDLNTFSYQGGYSANTESKSEMEKGSRISLGKILLIVLMLMMCIVAYFESVRTALTGNALTLVSQWE